MSKYLVTTGRKKYLLKGRNLSHNQAQAGVVICYEGWKTLCCLETTLGSRDGMYGCVILEMFDYLCNADGRKVTSHSSQSDEDTNQKQN